MKLEDTIVTLYKYCKSFDDDRESWKNPVYVRLSKIVERIKTGNSKDKVQQLASETQAEVRSEIKTRLPAICFSGKFPPGERQSEKIIEHNGLAILDFDHLNGTYDKKWNQLISQPYTVCCFRSPSGDGIKAVVRIKDTSKYLQHYKSLLKDFPDADVKCKDVARVCFESYDPNIYTNFNAIEYNKILVEQKVYEKREAFKEDLDFKNLEKWLQDKNNVFSSGNRNQYLFVFASACCRFGKSIEDTTYFIEQSYLSKDSDFTQNEAKRAIRSAYSSNDFGSAKLEAGTLMEKSTGKEVIIDLGTPEIADVIFGESVLADALKIYHEGYTSAESTGIPSIDRIFKWKRGELTVLTGIGNHGKSSFLNYLMINKTIKDGTKWAVFSPENNPAHEYYHDLTETIVGAVCTPKNADRPREEIYRKAYNIAAKHFYYIYPKDLLPTPEYIKSRFVELIIKHKVDGIVIDPFNQLSNDYSKTGGRDDKYLETFLSDCIRFAIINNVFCVIVAHPHKLKKNDDKSYDCPDVFDLAGGAMWNNKCDNILAYHRPNRHKDPTDPRCQLHSWKIRKQKIVGEPGIEEFEYSLRRRRFVFEDYPLKHFDLSTPEPELPKRLNEPKSKLQGTYGNEENPF